MPQLESKTGLIVGVANKRSIAWAIAQAAAAEGADAVAYHKTAAALSAFTRTGLTDIADIVPFIRFLVSDGWWMTGQTILVNGGYTTK